MLKILGIISLLSLLFQQTGKAILDRFPVEFESLRPQSINFLQSKLLVNMLVTNKTALDVRLEKFVGTISHGGAVLGTVNTTAAIVLPKQDTSRVQLRFDIVTTDILDRLAALLEGNGSVLDPFLIEGIVTVGSRNIPINSEVKLLS